MPYYVHAKNLTLLGEFSVLLCNGDSVGDFREFTDRQSAHANKRPDETVSYVSTYNDRDAWHEREQNRFDSGDYIPVPWQYRSKYELRHHFVHLSMSHPGMVAYTPSDEHGYQDRQVRVRPGKYLEQFYADEFDLSERQTYIAQCSPDAFVLKWAETAEEIERAYLGGPDSCMAHPVDYFSGLSQHPTAVYAGSDLRLAYYGDLSNVSARCFVWTDRKVYGRIYGTKDDGHVGTNGERLRGMLEREGYTNGYKHGQESDTFAGARIRAIRIEKRGRYDSDDKYLMPYVDGSDYARLSSDGKWFVISGGRGTRVSLKETGGYVYLSSGTDERYENEDEPETHTETCEHCGDEYDPDDYDAHGGWCGDCSTNSFECDECGDRNHDDNAHTFEHIDGTFCRSCYRAKFQECADLNCRNRFVPENFDEDTIAEREHKHVTDLCATCAERYEYCEDCDDAYDPDADGIDCPTCGHHPRCTETGDLLADVNAETAGERPQMAGDDVSPF